MYVVNLLLYFSAPAIFPHAYRLVKHVLSEDTRKKVNILGSKRMVLNIFFIKIKVTK